MKVKYLALLALLLGLSGCTTNQNPIQTESESPELDEYDKTVYVCFYADYNRVDLTNPLVDFMWYPGVPLPTEEIPDHTTIEPLDGFTEFVGWSTHTIIDDLDDLWDFENDVASSSQVSLNLYGIWLAPGELN